MHPLALPARRASEARTSRGVDQNALAHQECLRAFLTFVRLDGLSSVL
jgi:hypothetical protein